MDDAIAGSGDCEARIEYWGQPVLLFTSAAYIVAGLFVLWYARRHAGRHPISRSQISAYAVGLVLAGLGSMDYHGPVLGPQPLLHDGGLAVAIVAALAIDLTVLGVARFVRTWGLIAPTVVALVVIAFVPAASPALAGVAGVGLAVAEVAVYRRGLRPTTAALWSGLGCLAAGSVIFALSRTGGPLCDPQSWFQGHGVWHVLTAAALALWAVTAMQHPADRDAGAVRASGAVR
jgi:hypothetical protein